MVPSGNSVCVIVPDAGAGFAASCSTLDEINAGRGVVALTPQKGSGGDTSTVAVLVPDGGTEPRLIDHQGVKLTLSAINNIAAATVPSSDEIYTQAGTEPLS